MTVYTAEQLESDLAMISQVDGLHIGMLTPPELSALSRLVVAGLASRDYSGPSGLLGLGRVRVLGAARKQGEPT